MLGITFRLWTLISNVLKLKAHLLTKCEKERVKSSLLLNYSLARKSLLPPIDNAQRSLLFPFSFYLAKSRFPHNITKRKKEKKPWFHSFILKRRKQITFPVSFTPGSTGLQKVQKQQKVSVIASKRGGLFSKPCLHVSTYDSLTHTCPRLKGKGYF